MCIAISSSFDPFGYDRSGRNAGVSDPFMASAAVDFARQNQLRFLDELKGLLRIPSISTLPEHNGDTRRAAETLAAEMTRIAADRDGARG
jgi:hypothetical protein